MYLILLMCSGKGLLEMAALFLFLPKSVKKLIKILAKITLQRKKNRFSFNHCEIWLLEPLLL